MRRMIPLMLALAATGVTTTAAEAANASLRGSRAAMLQQNQVAKAHGLNFYRTPADISAAVERGELVSLPGNENYEVADFVRHPFTHPTVRLFVERLSADYRAACDQKLVVTSAVRPSNGQPSNAHALSVHPAGMAVDLRVSDRQQCRAWLEDALLGMEEAGVLNGIRERSPPHYHVAIFPEQYEEYAAANPPATPVVAVLEPAAQDAAEQAVAAADGNELPVMDAALTQPRSGVPLAATLLLLITVPLGRRVLRRRSTDLERRSGDMERRSLAPGRRSSDVAQP
jgi:hypothetical protein